MRNAAALTLFALTLTISAALLFVMEPMIAKMLLPLLGGSPGVWNTCMVFFQLTLLLGYLYAHVISTRLSMRRQMFVHALVVALPLLVLPTTVGGRIGTPPEEGQILWLIWILTVVVGLPFFAVCTTSPLMQKWYASLSLSSSSDPYFLFSASNFGSLFGLIAYPFLVEPRWTLSQQSSYWQMGYFALIAFTVACGVFALMSGCNRGARNNSSESGVPGETASAPGEEPSEIDTAAISHAEANAITPRRRLRWLMLTAIPSSLVLGLTTFVTTRMASFPLLWMLPLVVYLLTIIFAFARLPALIYTLLEKALPWVVLGNFVLITTYGIGHSLPNVFVGLPLQLATLFVVGMVFHGKVAADRPATKYLTEYYLIFSLGGVLGSSINALLAPVLLSSPLEYPLILGAALLLFVKGPLRKKSWTIDKFNPTWLVPVVVSLITYIFFSDPSRAYNLSRTGPFSLLMVLFDQGWRLAIPLLICFVLSKSGLQLRIALAILLLISVFVGDQDKNIVYRSRNFFGVCAVLISRPDNSVQMIHDLTVHGKQSMDPALRNEPISYYTHSSPIGTALTKLFGPVERNVLETSKERADTSAKKTLPALAVVGLGTGTSVAYAHPDQVVDLYEINPQVIRVATDPLYFTYLFSAYKRGVRMSFLVGDARLKLQEAPDNKYGVILLDAFSDDIPPLHLMTREALQLYLTKLAPGGIIAYNCSNKYYDLVSVVWNLVNDAHLNALICDDDYYDASHPLRAGSVWVIVSRERETLEQLRVNKSWVTTPYAARPDQPVWTDDYCNPLAFIKGI
ncbi:MAG TPA: fused MFS/spermidine synthase [Candidatus Obscuribacterales bacterium]